SRRAAVTPPPLPDHHASRARPLDATGFSQHGRAAEPPQTCLGTLCWESSVSARRAITRGVPRAHVEPCCRRVGRAVVPPPILLVTRGVTGGAAPHRPRTRGTWVPTAGLQQSADRLRPRHP